MTYGRALSKLTGSDPLSVEAISWAFQQPVPHASAKFVLVAMANHADADMRCWPSSAHLCSQTAQDRKTVQANLQRLREWGYIVDTGERRGATKQVPVYLLRQPENEPVKGLKNTPEVGGNTTGNGPIEDAQKRAASTDETGPNFPPNRPVFPRKQAQISPETGPKTGHGTIRNHQEPSGNHKTNARELPDWLPLDAWSGYLEMRKAKKKAPTERALDLLLIDLDKFRAAGHDVAAILDKSTVEGWTGIYEPKAAPAARASPRQAQQANTQRLLNRIQGNTSHDPDPRIIDINDRPA